MKVLVVEYEEEWREQFQDDLADQGYDILLAASIDDAQILFDANAPEICLVIVDSCVGSKAYDSGDLIRHIRNSGYNGLMIGASGSPGFHRQMIEDGCDNAVLKHLVEGAVAEANRTSDFS